MGKETGQAGAGVGARKRAPRANRQGVVSKPAHVSDAAIQAGVSVALRLWGEASTAFVVEQVFLAVLEHTESR